MAHAQVCGETKRDPAGAVPQDRALYIVIGQSNAAGLASVKDLVPPALKENQMAWTIQARQLTQAKWDENELIHAALGREVNTAREKINQVAQPRILPVV